MADPKCKNDLAVKTIIFDSENRNVEISEWCLGVIDVEHKEIHEGNAYKMFCSFLLVRRDLINNINLWTKFELLLNN